MAINKKLIHFNKRSSFDRELANNNILNTSIVFIKDTNEIYTHGNIYSCNEYINGDGISITTDNNGKKVISTTLDLTLFTVVDELPTMGDTNKIYVLLDSINEEPSNRYKEYIYVDGNWEIVGDAKLNSINLTNYYTKTEADNKYALKTALNSYYTKTESDNSYVKLANYNKATIDAMEINAAALTSKPITINTDELDTVYNWSVLKTHITRLYNNESITRPSKYGIIFSTAAHTGEVHQLWFAQPSGSIFHRGGNGDGWGSTWREMFDSSNYSNFITKNYVNNLGITASDSQKLGGKLADYFVTKDTIFQPSNYFNPYRPYNSLLQNTLYAADKRYTVNVTQYSYDGTEMTDISSDAYKLFDSNCEIFMLIPAGRYVDIEIILSNTEQYSALYCEGYLYLSFYNINHPTEMPTVSFYYGQTLATSQWVTCEGNVYNGSLNAGTPNLVLKYHTPELYSRKIRIHGVGSKTNSVGITQIEWHQERGTYAYNIPVFTKYCNQVTPYSIEAQGGFIGNLTGNVTGNLTGKATYLNWAIADINSYQRLIPIGWANPSEVTDSRFRATYDSDFWIRTDTRTVNCNITGTAGNANKLGGVDANKFIQAGSDKTKLLLGDGSDKPISDLQEDLKVHYANNEAMDAESVVVEGQSFNAALKRLGNKVATINPALNSYYTKTESDNSYVKLANYNKATIDALGIDASTARALMVTEISNYTTIGELKARIKGWAANNLMKDATTYFMADPATLKNNWLNDNATVPKYSMVYIKSLSSYTLPGYGAFEITCYGNRYHWITYLNSDNFTPLYEIATTESTVANANSLGGVAASSYINDSNWESKLAKRFEFNVTSMNMLTAGWYRIGKFKNGPLSSNNAIIFLRYPWYDYNAGSLIFSVSTSYRNATINQISQSSNYGQISIIDKIRVVSNDNANIISLDIHYTGTELNPIAVAAIGNIEVLDIAAAPEVDTSTMYITEMSTVNGSKVNGNFYAGKLIKTGSDNTKLLLGGGNDKPISDLQEDLKVHYANNEAMDAESVVIEGQSFNTALKRLGTKVANINPAYINGNSTVTGSQSLCDKHFNNGLAHFNTGAPATGAIVIQLPNSWISTMLNIEIDIYDFNSEITSKIICSGSTYGDSSWHGVNATVVGRLSRNIRFGYYNSKCCIILGNVDSAWYNTYVWLRSVETAYSNSDKWTSGYNIELVTDENLLSSVVTPPITKLDGNANNATNATNATNAEYSNKLKVIDRRDESLTPAQLTPRIISAGFKYSNTVGLSSGHNYAGVLSINPWSGNTSEGGGGAYQLAFSNDNAYLRSGIDNTWGNWREIVTKQSYDNLYEVYLPYLSGSNHECGYKFTISGCRDLINFIRIEVSLVCWTPIGITTGKLVIRASRAANSQFDSRSVDFIGNDILLAENLRVRIDVVEGNDVFYIEGLKVNGFSIFRYATICIDKIVVADSIRLREISNLMKLEPITDAEAEIQYAEDSYIPINIISSYLHFKDTNSPIGSKTPSNIEEKGAISAEIIKCNNSEFEVVSDGYPIEEKKVGVINIVPTGTNNEQGISAFLLGFYGTNMYLRLGNTLLTALEQWRKIIAPSVKVKKGLLLSDGNVIPIELVRKPHFYPLNPFVCKGTISINSICGNVYKVRRLTNFPDGMLVRLGRVSEGTSTDLPKVTFGNASRKDFIVNNLMAVLITNRSLKLLNSWHIDGNCIQIDENIPIDNNTICYVVINRNAIESSAGADYITWDGNSVIIAQHNVIQKDVDKFTNVFTLDAVRGYIYRSTISSDRLVIMLNTESIKDLLRARKYKVQIQREKSRKPHYRDDVGRYKTYKLAHCKRRVWHNSIKGKISKYEDSGSNIFRIRLIRDGKPGPWEYFILNKYFAIATNEWGERYTTDWKLINEL